MRATQTGSIASCSRRRSRMDTVPVISNRNGLGKFSIALIYDSDDVLVVRHKSRPKHVLPVESGLFEYLCPIPLCKWLGTVRPKEPHQRRSRTPSDHPDRASALQSCSKLGRLILGLGATTNEGREAAYGTTFKSVYRQSILNRTPGHRIDVYDLDLVHRHRHKSPHKVHGLAALSRTDELSRAGAVRTEFHLISILPE